MHGGYPDTCMVGDVREPYGPREFRFEQTPSLDPLVRRCPETGDGGTHNVSTTTDSESVEGHRVLIARARCSCGWEDSRIV
jgi:hypothetical protein